MKTHAILSLAVSLLLSLVVAPLFAQETSQYAIINYCNDGDFNIFLNSEIDSITYSRFDLDSIEYEDIVVQEVWTPDSVYRIPLASIDSIGFQLPKPKYSEESFPIMDEMLPFIVAVDSLNITFSSSTPKDMLPSLGNILVSNTWESPMEDGFAGRVIDKRETAAGIEFVCEQVGLKDIFESLVFVSKCVTSDDVPANAKPNILARKSFWDPNIVIPEDEIQIPTIEFGLGFGDVDDNPLSFNYKPTMTIKYMFYIVKDQPERLKLSFTMRHDFSLRGKHEFDFLKNTEGKGSREWLKDPIPIPIPNPAVAAIVRPYVQFGAFLDAKAKAKFEFDLAVYDSMTFGIEYDERIENEDERMKFICECDGGIDNEKTDVSMSLEGSMATGLAIVLGTKIVHGKLFKAEGHFHVGPMIRGKIDISAQSIFDGIENSTLLYNTFKDTKVDLDVYLSARAQFEILSRVKLAKRGTWKGAKWEQGEPLVDGSFQKTWPLFEWYLLPEFDKPYVGKITSESATCTLYPKRELLKKVNIGVAFEDYSTGKVIEKDFGAYRSQSVYESEYQSLLKYNETVSPLEENTIYKVSPTVKLFGVKMNATPSVDYGNSDRLIVSPRDAKVVKGKTIEVLIIGGSGSYEITDYNSDIAKSIELKPVSGEKKAILSIYGVEVGETVITVTDKQNRALRTDINVSVVAESEWGNLDDVPGTDL